MLEDKTYVPVGVESKEYTLVQHTDVLNTAKLALNQAKIASDKVSAELKLSQYGERMALSLYLPEEYNFDPGDNHAMALRFECVNSVDGSTRFRAMLGWFRFVCSNGLVIGVTYSDVRKRHSGDIRLEDVGKVLMSGISEADNERNNFKCWRARVIASDHLVDWVNNDLRERWGFKAAARAYHIAKTGRDGNIAGQYKAYTPATIPMRSEKPVPGMSGSCKNLFDLSQIMAWLAKERRDLQAQLEWREMIPDLIKAFQDPKYAGIIR